MWCRTVRGQLSAYADGELSATEARSVAEHLSRCEGCAREHRSLQTLAQLTAAVPVEDVPAGLHSAIMMRLAYADMQPAPARRPPAPSVGLAMFNPLMWAAVSGAAAALVVGLVQHRTPEAPRSKPSAEPPRMAQLPKTEAPSAPNAKAALRHEQPEAPAPSPEPTPAPLVSEKEPAAPAVATAASVASTDAVAAGVSEQLAPKLQRAKPVEPLALKPQSQEPAAPARLAAEPLPEAPAPAPVPSTQGLITAMPGDPLINSVTAPSSPDLLGMEKEPSPSMRMAGTPVEGEMPEVDDEGLRPLRMFLEERNRSVPQPPQIAPGDRRLRKL